MPSFAWRTSINWIIPGFRNGYRTLARPRAVFIDFAVAGDSDHMPSSGQKLELHLQVTVLLPDAIPLILLGAIDFRGQKPGIIQYTPRCAH